MRPDYYSIWFVRNRKDMGRRATLPPHGQRRSGARDGTIERRLWYDDDERLVAGR